MNTTIKPSHLRGTVNAPPSKSMAHRLLIAAALADGESTITNVEYSQDVLATIDCLRAIGAVIEECEHQNALCIKGVDPHTASVSTLHCRESGSTMRFMIPIALLSDKEMCLTGQGRLPERPMKVYSDICASQNLRFDQSSDGIRLCGPLKPSVFRVPGDVSSQFITGLLYALPLLDGDSEIRLTTALESRPYIDLTLSALRRAGIQVEEIGKSGYLVKGNQRYSPITASVEGDYSNAAFIEALNLLGNDVTVTGLDDQSYQGDKNYRTYFREMSEGFARLDIRDCPDLAPILMTMGAALCGVHLQGTRRLKIKESDRGIVMAQELSKFGAKISVHDDEIIVHPTTLCSPTEILEGHNDHRIVMSLSVLATKYGGTICGSQAINKSYPTFYDVLSSIGGSIVCED